MINVDEVRQHMEGPNNEEQIKILLEHDENQWRETVSTHLSTAFRMNKWVSTYSFLTRVLLIASDQKVLVIS